MRKTTSEELSLLFSLYNLVDILQDSSSLLTPSVLLTTGKGERERRRTGMKALLLSSPGGVCFFTPSFPFFFLFSSVNR